MREQGGDSDKEMREEGGDSDIKIQNEGSRLTLNENGPQDGDSDSKMREGDQDSVSSNCSLSECPLYFTLICTLPL